MVFPQSMSARITEYKCIEETCEDKYIYKIIYSEFLKV
jgi:hypothetical protein